MVHLPVNHRLRRPYRMLAALAGLYVLIFGIAGLVATWGTAFFARDDIYALGLRTNPAFSVLSILVGATVVGASAIGGNVSHLVNQACGFVFLVAGMIMLTVLRTGANLLDFTVTTCIVSYVLGLFMVTAGLYGRVGPPRPPAAEESVRPGEGGSATQDGGARAGDEARSGAG